MTGTVRTIHYDKQFGFIQTPKGDFFFHRSAVNPPESFTELQVGTEVEFDASPNSPKGPRAENVRVP